MIDEERLKRDFGIISWMIGIIGLFVVAEMALFSIFIISSAFLGRQIAGAFIFILSAAFLLCLWGILLFAGKIEKLKKRKEQNEIQKK